MPVSAVRFGWRGSRGLQQLHDGPRQDMVYFKTLPPRWASAWCFAPWVDGLQRDVSAGLAPLRDSRRQPGHRARARQDRDL